ncbi:Granule-bound starch synthase 1, chloroplastic/amyloplastic [Sesamum alatum]|uniref:Starch synthase, chloroplastic/amyloplastic n=1 Tax=Sesamum alatum TaxID=300844 RepID=A0AAE1Y0J0_9LAMI|nr:Granule-bound starch synthase 1, chloroplastic/amyloplastic [Sesamum alatum]
MNTHPRQTPPSTVDTPHVIHLPAKQFLRCLARTKLSVLFWVLPCDLTEVSSMATVTASHFVSHIHGGAASVDSKSNLAQIGLRTQPVTHNGLRSVNKVDMLQLKSNVKAAAKKSRSMVKKTEKEGAPAKIVCGSGMSLVFVSAEVGPWSKTGGLGDVLGGLPPAMAANGHRAMTVSPRYDQYKDAWDTSVVVEIQVGDRLEKVRFFHCYKRGVDRVFVDHPVFLEKVWGKTKSKIYGPTAGTDYKDNQLRFSLLCQAALLAPLVLSLNSSKYFSGPYGEDVVFIANDWHTALLPCYLKTMYQSRGIYMHAKVAYCIHNIAYQGRFAFSDFSLLNLPDEYRSSFDFVDGYTKPVKGRKINWMKAGILESDRVVTVSPYYAQELVSGVEKGVELDNIIRKTGITGIVNGMDTQEWNPATDKYIDSNYDITTVMDAKPLLKEALQAEVGLPVDSSIPVIGFIGRLEEQKGSDILVTAVSKFIKRNVQIIILGTGKKSFEQQIEQLEVLYPDKARGVAKFNVPLAHMITAGADFMMVPSRFEPCGLIQLHAMRYGTIPICASTGGLVDTVKEGYTGFHMGDFNVECATVDPADVLKIAAAVDRALAVYGTFAYKEMIKNCMSQDLSWKGPAKNWELLLLSLGAAGSEPGIEGEEIAPLAKENIATP